MPGMIEDLLGRVRRVEKLHGTKCRSIMLPTANCLRKLGSARGLRRDVRVGSPSMTMPFGEIRLLTGGRVFTSQSAQGRSAWRRRPDLEEGPARNPSSPASA
jgi:hypothetical protein